MIMDHADTSEYRLSRHGEVRKLDMVLQSHDLARVEMPPDGNCLYRALAHQMARECGEFRGKKGWAKIKARIFERMRTVPLYRSRFELEILCDFNSWEEYLRVKSSERGHQAWGGLPEVIVFCDEFMSKVSIYTYNTGFDVAPTGNRPASCELKIAHVGRNHYDSLIPTCQVVGGHVPPQPAEFYYRNVSLFRDGNRLGYIKVEVCDRSCMYDFVHEGVYGVTAATSPYKVSICASGRDAATAEVLDDLSFQLVVSSHPTVDAHTTALPLSLFPPELDAVPQSEIQLRTGVVFAAACRDDGRVCVCPGAPQIWVEPVIFQEGFLYQRKAWCWSPRKGVFLRITPLHVVVCTITAAVMAVMKIREVRFRRPMFRGKRSRHFVLSDSRRSMHFVARCLQNVCSVEETIRKLACECLQAPQSFAPLVASQCVSTEKQLPCDVSMAATSSAFLSSTGGMAMPTDGLPLTPTPVNCPYPSPNMARLDSAVVWDASGPPGWNRPLGGLSGGGATAISDTPPLPSAPPAPAFPSAAELQTHSPEGFPGNNTVLISPSGPLMSSGPEDGSAPAYQAQPPPSAQEVERHSKDGRPGAVSAGAPPPFSSWPYNSPYPTFVSGEKPAPCIVAMTSPVQPQEYPRTAIEARSSAHRPGSAGLLGRVKVPFTRTSNNTRL
eukprot:RCo042617